MKGVKKPPSGNSKGMRHTTLCAHGFLEPARIPLASAWLELVGECPFSSPCHEVRVSRLRFARGRSALVGSAVKTAGGMWEGAESRALQMVSSIWLWLKKPVPKWKYGPGKWKYGPKPAVCPHCLILSHTHMEMYQRVPDFDQDPFATCRHGRFRCGLLVSELLHGGLSCSVLEKGWT